MNSEFEPFFTPLITRSFFADMLPVNRFAGLSQQISSTFLSISHHHADFDHESAIHWLHYFHCLVNAQPLPVRDVPLAMPLRLLAQYFLDAARPVCSEQDNLALTQIILEHVECQRIFQQQRKIGSQAAMLTQTVIAELREIAMDFTEPGQPLNFDELELSLFGMLAEWGEITTAHPVILEWEFVMRFMKQVASRHAATSRLWELLLLKLDRIINDQASGHLHHALSNSIETLTGAIPRFGFCKDFTQRILGNFNMFQAPVGAWLLMRIIFDAYPQGRLPQVSQHVLAPFAWAQALLKNDSEDSAGLQVLAIAVSNGRKKLRFGWERAQLDWYDLAAEQLQRFISNAHATELLEHSAQAWCDQVCEALLSDPERQQQGLHIMRQLFREACAANACASDASHAKLLFRYRLARNLTANAHFSAWLRVEELSRALARFQFPAQVTGEFSERVGYLLRELAPVVHEFTQLSPLNLPSSDNTKPVAQSLRVLALGIPLLCKLHDSYHVIAELRWYCAQWLEALPEVPDGELLRHATLELAAAQSSEKPNLAAATLREFAPQWVELCAARKLHSRLKSIALLTSTHVLTATPEYAELVGESGMQACVRDNHFTLLRAVQVLSSPTGNPKQALLWWWNIAVGAYLVNRAKPALEANLIGMERALRHHLNEAETAAVFGLIQNVFSEALGTTFLKENSVDVLEKFQPIMLQGPLWQQVFHHTRACPKAFNNALGVLQSPQEREIDDPLERQLFALLATYAEHVRVSGDREACWLAVMPLIQRLLANTQASGWDSAWLRVAARLPECLALGDSAVWLDIAEQGRALFHQVALGQALLVHHQELAKHISASALVLSSLTAPQRHLAEREYARLFSAFLQVTGEQFTTNTPSLATLQLTRYLLEKLVPSLQLPRLIWQMIWTQLEDRVLNLIALQTQPVLHLWIMQLDLTAQGLEQALEISQKVLATPDTLFAESSDEEQAWRTLFSGLLAAAVVPEHAPISGLALAQRLLLGSKLFIEETPDTWRERHATMRQAFGQWLPEPLAESWDKVHQTLMEQLGWLAEIYARTELRNVDPYYMLLHRLPGCRTQWWIDCWSAGAGSGGSVNNGAFICGYTHWPLPSGTQLNQTQSCYAAACHFQGMTKTLQEKWRFWQNDPITLHETDQKNLHLLLCRLALKEDGMPLTWLLFDTLSHLTDSAAERYHTLIIALRRRVQQQYGTDHLLTRRVGELLPMVSASSLAWHLLHGHGNLADIAVRELKPFANTGEISRHADKLARCARDFGLILRRIGLHLSEQAVCEDLGLWYWERCKSKPNYAFLMPC